MKEYYLLMALICTYGVIRNTIKETIESVVKDKETKLDLFEIFWMILTVTPTIIFWMLFFNTK